MRLGAWAFYTFVSCTCEVWDTPFACSASGWTVCGNLDGRRRRGHDGALLSLLDSLSSLNGNPRLPTMTDSIVTSCIRGVEGCNGCSQFRHQPEK